MIFITSDSALTMPVESTLATDSFTFVPLQISRDKRILNFFSSLSLPNLLFLLACVRDANSTFAHDFGMEVTSNEEITHLFKDIEKPHD